MPKILAKASMRNTNFKKYAGLFRRPPNVANRIRLRRATSNAHVFNKISYAGLSKWSQRGGLENLSVNRSIKHRNPLKTLTISGLRKMQKLAHLTQYLTLLKKQFNTQEYRSGHNEAVLKICSREFLQSAKTPCYA